MTGLPYSTTLQHVHQGVLMSLDLVRYRESLSPSPALCLYLRTQILPAVHVMLLVDWGCDSEAGGGARGQHEGHRVHAR